MQKQTEIIDKLCEVRNINLTSSEDMQKEFEVLVVNDKMKKYELTTECKEFLGRKLYRIKALISFCDVKEGDLGGWIEKEENLSQKGDAWVCDNAWVGDNARVCDNARIYDNAWVGDNAWVYGDSWVYGNAEIKKKTHLLEIGFIGSRDDVTTFFRTKDKEIFVKCGCFSGNIDEFEKQVQKVHGDDKHGRVYALAIAMAREQIELD